MDLLQCTSFIFVSLSVFVVFVTYPAETEAGNSYTANQMKDQLMLSKEYKFAPSNHTRNATLLNMLNLLGKRSSGGLPRFNPGLSPSFSNGTLAYLLRLGNGTFNASLISDALNRTARGYGGGYGGGGGGGCCGGGFDPLWMLLFRDHDHEEQPQKQNDDNLAELALLTLLGLALISRMPTQG